MFRFSNVLFSTLHWGPSSKQSYFKFEWNVSSVLQANYKRWGILRSRRRLYELWVFYLHFCRNYPFFVHNMQMKHTHLGPKISLQQCRKICAFFYQNLTFQGLKWDMIIWDLVKHLQLQSPDTPSFWYIVLPLNKNLVEYSTGVAHKEQPIQHSIVINNKYFLLKFIQKYNQE